jgi:hypothetical protein
MPALYQDHINQTGALIASKNGTWNGIDAESIARMPMMPTRRNTHSRSAAGMGLSPSRR